MCPVGEAWSGADAGTVPPRRTALVVDREQSAAEWIAEVLTSAGFDVRTARGTIDAVAAARERVPDLVVAEAALDAGADGVELARRLRALSSTFIVLHSERDEEIDIVRGLNAGADAFLLRPLSRRELKVRIAAVMRRPPVPGRARPASAPAAPLVPAPSAPSAPSAPLVPAAEPPAPALRFEEGAILLGPLRVDPEQGLAFVDDRPLVLNPRAFDLLEVLLYAAGEPRTTADLAIAVHDDPAASADLARVDLLVERLVGSLRAAAPGHEWIVRGDEGYRLV